MLPYISILYNEHDIFLTVLQEYYFYFSLFCTLLGCVFFLKMSVSK